MPRYLNPCSDIVFKKIFGEHEDILKSFLNAVLPLDKAGQIVSLEYLSAEQVPVIPELKRSIVDVKCTDQQGRVFIVEMQIEWVTAFMQRMLFNASTAYVKQLPKGFNYHLLQPVYGLALLAENFDESNQWYHHYKMVNIENTHKTIEGLQLIFIELKKFKDNHPNQNTLQNFWLRFLSEVDEQTRHLPEELLSVQEIEQAANLLEESAFSPSELSYYDSYWDAVSTEKTLISGKMMEGMEKGLAKGLEEGLTKGLEEGRAKGLAEGLTKGKVETQKQIAKALLKENMPIAMIAKTLNLSLEELQTLLNQN